MPEPRFYVAVTHGLPISPTASVNGRSNPERSGWVGVLDRAHLHRVMWDVVTQGRRTLAWCEAKAQAECDRLSALHPEGFPADVCA